MNDELIRKILDIAPCVGSETGFCRAHDQRVTDCEEYFNYQKDRIAKLSPLIAFDEHQRGFQEGWHDAMLFGHSSEWTDLRKAIKELMKRHGVELEAIQRGDEWQPCPGNGCVGGLVTYFDRDLGEERSVVCSVCEGSGAALEGTKE